MYILEDLWQGCFASDAKSAKRDSEYARISLRMAKHRETVAAELFRDGQASFDRFDRAKETLAEIRAQDAFIEGFRSGARMILDILGEHQSQFS